MTSRHSACAENRSRQTSLTASTTMIMTTMTSLLRHAVTSATRLLQTNLKRFIIAAADALADRNNRILIYSIIGSILQCSRQVTSRVLALVCTMLS